MSSICVDVDFRSVRKDCGALVLECVYPQEKQNINSHMRTDQRPPEWADASEEVETSTTFQAVSVPIGMSDYDPGALSQYQQKRLNQLKVATVDANYKYLADHPELKAMITLFLQHLLKTRPKNLRTSAGEFFRSEKTLAREIHKYFRMQFWKPPDRASSVSSASEDLSAPTTSLEEEEEETAVPSEDAIVTADVEEKQVEEETSVYSDEEARKAGPEPQNMSGDTQLMIHMAQSYDSKLILNLSAHRLQVKKHPRSSFTFRKQVSFGGSLLPRTQGWEVDHTFHFYVEDIQPEISQLYGEGETQSGQRKLKFFGNT